MTELAWFKSSHSDNTGGECVEVAVASGVHIRDSKAPSRPHLTVTATTWTAFLAFATDADR
jgi:hypothetical protein